MKHKQYHVKKTTITLKCDAVILTNDQSIHRVCKQVIIKSIDGRNRHFHFCHDYTCIAERQ
jgi:hypothetical protein